MKKATIYDVAREAGVSLATVSRVINGSSVVREKTKEKVMKVIDCLLYTSHPAMKTAPKTIDYLSESAKNHFDKVCSLLDDLEIDYVIDTNLVRGLDYYSHTVFEIISDDPKLGAGATVGGGGRYNGCLLYTSKDFMIRHHIPTAKYVEVTDFEKACKEVDHFDFPLVIKADGLAAGKGVVIVENKEDAISTLKEMMVDGALDGAGSKVVLEEFLTGFECSLLCFTDGKTIVPMVSAKDHKPVSYTHLI